MSEFYSRAKVSNFIIYIFDSHTSCYRLSLSMSRKNCLFDKLDYFGTISDWFMYHKIYDNKVPGKLIFIFIFCRCNLKSLTIKQ